MNNTKLDRRVLRTKQQIRQAIVELLSEKDANSITVRELAEHAGINRGTFYIHYNDINDLLEQLVNEASEKVCEVCQKYPPEETPSDSYPFLTDMFQMLKDDPQLFNVLLANNGSQSYAERICLMLQENYLDKLLQLYFPADPQRCHFASGFIVAGCVHQALLWLNTGTVETPEEMAQITGDLIMHGIHALQI